MQVQIFTLCKSATYSRAHDSFTITETFERWADSKFPTEFRAMAAARIRFMDDELSDHSFSFRLVTKDGQTLVNTEPALFKESDAKGEFPDWVVPITAAFNGPLEKGEYSLLLMADDREISSIPLFVVQR